MRNPFKSKPSAESLTKYTFVCEKCRGLFEKPAAKVVPLNVDGGFCGSGHGQFLREYCARCAPPYDSALRQFSDPTRYFRTEAFEVDESGKRIKVPKSTH